MEKKENTTAAVDVTVEEIEGYDWCGTYMQACLNDCLGPWHGTQTMNDLN